LHAEPEGFGHSAAVYINREAQWVVHRSRKFWQVGKVLKHGIDVIVKDARVLIVCEECFIIVVNLKKVGFVSFFPSVI
jgi:hypothetical protein